MRPALEIADIFRRHGPAWRAAHAGHVSLSQLKVMAAIETCRTAALGGHLEGCEDCGHRRIAYNSCVMGKFSNGEPESGVVPASSGFQRLCSPLQSPSSRAIKSHGGGREPLRRYGGIGPSMVLSLLLGSRRVRLWGQERTQFSVTALQMRQISR